MFEIANAVDVEFGYDIPVDETEMCEAIEYAEENGYEIYLEPDEDDVRNKREINVRQHIRMRPKGTTPKNGA